MPGRINDIDTIVLPLDRRVLGQNRDAALAFQIIRIHHALGHSGPITQGSRLLQ